MQIVTFDALGAEVKGYIHDDYDTLAAHKVRPAMLICPGGAYRWRSPREKDPVALRFSAMGYNTFIVEYSCGALASGYRPLRELAAAVRAVRARAEEWHIDRNQVAVLGFSAGGHLACSLGTLWDDPVLALGADARPDALILCYPVITTGEFAHRESADWVSGGDPELREKLSLETRVGPGMPPTFVWHCTADASVPVENTLLLVNAMQRAKVPYECHLFAGGAHGISMCTQEVETPYPDIAPWADLCATWLNTLFHFIP